MHGYKNILITKRIGNTEIVYIYRETGNEKYNFCIDNVKMDNMGIRSVLDDHSIVVRFHICYFDRTFLYQKMCGRSMLWVCLRLPSVYAYFSVITFALHGDPSGLTTQSSLVQSWDYLGIISMPVVKEKDPMYKKNVF